MMQDQRLLVIGMGCLVGAVFSNVILDPPRNPATAAERGEAFGVAITQVAGCVVGVVLIAAHVWRTLRRRGD